MCAYKKNLMYQIACVYLYVYTFIFTKNNIIRILLRVDFTRGTHTANQKSFGGKFVSITAFIRGKLKGRTSASMEWSKTKCRSEKAENSAIPYIYNITRIYVCTNLYKKTRIVDIWSFVFFTRHSFNHRHKMKINDF